MNNLLIEITTPYSYFAIRECNMVTLPTSAGQIGILPRHIPLVSSLVEGVINSDKGDKIFITGGFLQVKEDKISILTEFAIKLTEENRSNFEKEIIKLEEKNIKNPDLGLEFNIKHKRELLAKIDLLSKV